MENDEWIFILNTNPGGYNGGSGAHYQIGTFDGEHFYPDNPEFYVLDYGKDYYATTSYFRGSTQATNTSPYLIAWMSNWQYASSLPTNPWRG